MSDQTTQWPESQARSSEYPNWSGPEFTTHPAPAPAEPFNAPTTQETTQVDPMENEDMFRSLMAKVADKVIEASGFAKRVQELEAQVSSLKSEAGMWEQKHREEAAAHEATKNDLNAVRKTLGDEKEYARLQREETDRFRQERDAARSEAANAQEHINRVEADNRSHVEYRSHAEQEAATLREQVTRLNAKIANMVQALQA